jgi:DNA-binding NarL/FixJ family response regulator
MEFFWFDTHMFCRYIFFNETNFMSVKIKVEEGKIGVMIIDPRPVIRYGIKAMMEKEDKLKFTFAAQKDHNAAETLMMSYLYDIVILSDHRLGDKMVLQARKLVALSPEANFIGLTDEPDQFIMKKVIDMGFKGYIRTDINTGELFVLLNSIIRGDNYYSSTIANDLLKEANAKYALRKRMPEQVSDRELEVLRLLSRGKSTKDIGMELKLSPRTVETHRKNLLKKFDARNVAELVMIGFDYDLLSRGGSYLN